MRVFAVFALIQISGILGDPGTLELNQTRIDEIRRIATVQSFIEAVGSRPFSELPSNMTESYRIKCTEHGGPDAYIAAVESINVFENSLRALENEVQFQLGIDASMVDGALDSAIEAFCHWASTIDSLIRTFMDSFKRCWSPDERISVDLMRNISNAMVHYVCGTEGSHVSAFLTADGPECYESSKIELRNCSRPGKKATFFTNNDTVTHPPWSMPIFGLNTQACRAFETYQNCTVGVLEKCPNPTTSYETNSLFNVVKKSLGCEEFLQE